MRRPPGTGFFDRVRNKYMAGSGKFKQKNRKRGKHDAKKGKMKEKALKTKEELSISKFKMIFFSETS